MKIRIVYLLLGILVLCLLACLIDERWMLPCLFHRLTGWDCPLCGGQRMLVALLHADFRAAFALNPFLMCSLPLYLLWVVCYIKPKFLQQSAVISRLCSDSAILIYIFMALLWGIIRNL